MADLNCRYLQSVEYPDKLTVGARTKSIGDTSFIQEYLIVSEKLGPAAYGRGVLVMYDFNTSEKKRVPDQIRTAMQEIEKRVRG